MLKEEKIHIVIAEVSPVLSSGFSQCLRRLPGVQTNVIEVKTLDDLTDCVRGRTPDVVLVNPTFGGMFHPAQFRAEFIGRDFKIVAIEIGKLSKQATALYDEVVSVIDDTETI